MSWEGVACQILSSRPTFVVSSFFPWDAKTKAEYFDLVLVEGNDGQAPGRRGGAVGRARRGREAARLRAAAGAGYKGGARALSRFRPHTLVEAKEMLPLDEFTSKHEFLHQAQRRFTTVVHNRNWRDLEQADAGPVPR